MRGWGGCFQEQFRSEEQPDAKPPKVSHTKTRPLPGTHQQDCRRSTTPINVATGHRYRGVNMFVLSMSPLAFTSGDPRWCSYRQAAARGWQARKGEKATPVYFYKPIEIEKMRRTAAARHDAFRCCERSRSFMLRKL